MIFRNAIQSVILHVSAKEECGVWKLYYSDMVFPKNTALIIGKRANFICSNPDCGALTCGPNTGPEKYTLVGDAAHNFGVKAGTARIGSVYVIQR